jgi:hypothetical protein
MNKFMTVLFTVAVAMNASGQVKSKKPGTEIVTNATIVNLIKAGLGDDIILGKIETSKTNFDLSSDGLIALKNQQVDNVIIKAMLNKTNGIKSDQAITEKKDNNVPQVDLINQVYLFNKTTTQVTPLEKSVANLKTKMKLMGYGGASVLYIIDGNKSPVRLTAPNGNAFIINTGGAAPELTLYKLAINKNNRQATTQTIKGGFSSGGMTSGDNAILFNITALKNGIYQITPATNLASGEYFFATKPIVSSTTIDVYAFGID